MKQDNEQDQQMTVNLGKIDIDPSQLTTPPDVEDLPILATRNLVLFPEITIPISLGRENSVATATIASEKSLPIGVVCQLRSDEEQPAVTTGLYKYGVVADVLKVFELPDGSHTALVRARGKFKILGRGPGANIPEANLSARIRLIDEPAVEMSRSVEVLVEQIKASAINLIRKTTESAKEIVFTINQFDNPVELVNHLCTNMAFDPQSKIKLLSASNFEKRAYELLSLLSENEQKVDISREIIERTKSNLDQNQRNAFLQQQMETIREELYGDTTEADELLERATDSDMTQEVLTVFEKEVEKLRRLNQQSPDYSVQYQYLETLLALPWTSKSEVNSDFGKASDILESDHYGLEKVKERILEQLAVLLNNPHGKAPILCLVGAPGVGKTSLGKSVARALGRDYQRVSLGGLHDESEIRGHRRTYIGAMPGRIIDAMKRAGKINPVLLLDEIDKIGTDYKGDPSSALLEVLDPEQNKFFHDNYVDIDYDLSNVLFIATANTLSSIQQPLLDRMEVIDISGYLLEEKIEIARRHLLPRVLEEHNVASDAIDVPDETLAAVIEGYTSESGVRQLEKCLAKIVRKYVLAKMSGKDFPSVVKPENLYDILGLARYSKDEYEGNEYAGVVTGLAWTQVGGEILLAEASLSSGKGEKLTITGNLGDVMKESATIAYEWVKAHAAGLGIDEMMFEKHFPEGAIPKDGPSAGITIATAIVSAYTGRRVAERLAMTGEITLRGRVLPVGGIKEKILAAKRAGITDIVLSEKNRRDIEDIAPKYLDGLTFHYVETVGEVIDFAVTDVAAVK